MAEECLTNCPILLKALKAERKWRVLTYLRVPGGERSGRDWVELCRHTYGCPGPVRSANVASSFECPLAVGLDS